MTFRVTACALAAVLASSVGSSSQAPPAAPPASGPRYEIEARLDPATHRLTVRSRVNWPGQPTDGLRTFVLNAALAITRSDPPVREVSAAGLSDAVRPAGGAPLPLKAYRVQGEEAVETLRLEYEGVVAAPLSDPQEQYTRGFRETSGFVGAEGVYLAGASHWYPRFGPDLMTFSLVAEAPEGWHLISQGQGASRGPDGKARWDWGGPMDEIYLVGGPLHRFADRAGAVETLVYLHEPDASLAGKYLAATAQYLEMYRTLVGPYPYGKFALVENYWETGYGMPSFTLLGPQVIRFPFIINSSYPHEILHNWWGNSVFVDHATGNWCEGLTAYMADHLIQEQRGTADEYRRAVLQKYRDYVRTGRDFPLAEFRERESAATEAVGYGKALMGYHALRLHIGDEAFRETAARFYREYRGTRAGFRDIQRVAEAVSGKTLGWIFDDLITRTGAAALEVKAGAGSVRRQGGRFVVDGLLMQTQEGPPYSLDVPIVVQTEGGGEVAAIIRSAAVQQPFSIETDAQPVGLAVDPRFDVFRRLDPRETPPSIGQIFGEPAILAVLPSEASQAEQAAYYDLVRGWQSDAHQIDVALDSSVASLPRDRSVWMLGRGNRLAAQALGGQPGLRVAAETVEIGGERMSTAGHTFVAVFRHPENPEKAAGWIAADPLAALPGLGRKLPHYGKYSYLGFEGGEPVNTIKGGWQVSDSPLRIDLRPDGSRAAPLPPLRPDHRKALAELPPVFSSQAMLEHVERLASPALQGRGLCSPGLAQAMDYVAGRFQEYGLRPGGDDGSYFQRFTVAAGPDGRACGAANVVAILPGANPAFAGQSAVIGAHVDHLGLGWPDVHAGDEGKVHPGADDNASGVAVMLELARVMAAGGPLPRSVVFVAFTGEEAGRLGSRHFVGASANTMAGVEGMINLDTVGRLGTQHVTVLGTGTAAEWPHIFRGASFVTGVESRSVPDSLESSDQVSFVERGVPAVQIFTAPHADYHRPSDTADKIDAAGLVKVASFVKEAIVYLAERAEPLTSTISASAGHAPAAPAATPSAAGLGGAPPAGSTEKPASRASFGTVPDFSFQGTGVRVAGVVPGSPAATAGVREGDIVLQVGERRIGSLQEYAAALRAVPPGQRITVTILRGTSELRLSVALAVR
ncbi:MAG TPA: M20/M25/M40 family metallo-hydrolase [Vicinamibacterales bacterium]|nr:M20/M25/M40 family metallo-hydrolase [Vicinamibacterales bacterium]